MGAGHQNTVNVLEMAREAWVISFYLCVVRLLRNALPLLLRCIVPEIISENYSDVVELPSCLNVPI